MAEHLASIFGTEKDRVNCPFYFKIGACRHGERCSRLHNKPTLSQTILMSNMYQSPAAAAIANPTAQINTDPRAIQEHFEDFYEDIFEELAKFGELEGLNVCDNTSDHLIGNVYVKFREEESALAALNALSGRFYSGRPILCEFSPVTDFRESTCRQYEEQTCNRGGYCNFMHLKPISRQLRKILFGRYKRRDDDRGGRDDYNNRSGRDGRSGGYDRDDRRGPPGGGPPGRGGGYDDRRGGGYDDRRGGGYDDRRGGGPDRGRGGGYDDRRRDGPYDRGRGDDRGGGGRRDRSRDRYDDRRRDDDRRDDRRDDKGVSAKGMSDADRRAMFAKWNEDKGGGNGDAGGEKKPDPEDDDRYRR